MNKVGNWSIDAFHATTILDWYEN